MQSAFRNNTHFQEKFEDSEVQSDFYNQNDNNPGRPIQLIRMRPGGKVEVDQDALDIISDCDLPVGFCCIAGKYRTGKSFLLNKLLKLQGNGFRVDPSVTACTEGIWMWSKPILSSNGQNYIFFIDTEGTASTNRDTTSDTKVFTLANLISSFFIYNSVGAIDEKSISQLNVVTQLSKNIVLRENEDLKNNQENLYRYMPKFLWLIRDFILQPTDKNGRRLTPAEYLQDVLNQQSSAVKVDQNTKKIRRALMKYYKQRDCVTLVRPANEEKDLQNLNQIDDHRLRADFIEGVNNLRDKILKNTGPKMYSDNPLYGGSIAAMIESYVNMINTGVIPSIQTAWQKINEDQGMYAYNKGLDKFHQLYGIHFSEEEPKGQQQIYQRLRSISQASLEQFRKKISQPNQFYQEQLKKYLRQKQNAIIQVNKTLKNQLNVRILKQCMQPILQKIQSNAYDSDPTRVNDDLSEAFQKFNLKAKGQDKSQTLAMFMTKLNPFILNIGKKDNESFSKQQQIERLNRQQQAQIDNLQKTIASLKNQAESNKNAADARLSKDPKKLSSTPGGNQKQMTKKTSKGCCGDAKCSIM